DEPVPDPPTVHDVAAGLGIELAPEATGVGVERPGAAHRPESPDVAEELLFGEHALGLGGERAKRRELLVREVHVAIAHPHLAPGGVDEDVADARWSFPPLVAPAEDGTDTSRDLRIVERLRDVIVGSLGE